MSYTPEQKFTASLETASHEAGHALVAKHIDRNATCKVIMLIAKGAREESYPAGDKGVHGKHEITEYRCDAMDVATVGYAGILGMLLFAAQRRTMDRDAVFAELSKESPKEWSKEDLEQIRGVPLEKRREAFDRAWDILEGRYDDLRQYTNHIAGDFADLDTDGMKYTIPSLNFSTPAKESITAS